MHDKNNTGGHDSKMMWLMMLGCMLPVLLIGFTNGGGGRNLVWTLLIVGGMLGLHWFVMRRGHGHGGHCGSHGDNADNSKITNTSSGSAGGSTTAEPPDHN